MTEPKNTTHPRDRREDQAEIGRDVSSAPTERAGLQRRRRVKPPVLRRRTLRWISAAWILLVLWGTLGPLGTAGGPWIKPVSAWSWVPPLVPLSYASYNDIFTNVLVYLPVGVALGLLCRRRGGFWPLELTLAAFLAVCLSYATEFAQQFMPARTSDLVDLFVNSGAALVGCLLAPATQRRLRRVHEYLYLHGRSHPWLTATWIVTALIFVLMTMPWDFHRPALEIDYRRDLDLLDFRRFGAFLILGFLIAMAMIERHGRGPLASGEALKRLFICCVLFEAAQIFIHSHACGMLDIATALFGGLAGIGAARWLTGTALAQGGLPTHARRLLAALALPALIVGYVGLAVWGILADNPSYAGAGVIRLPFETHFLESFDLVLIDVFERMFIYASVTLLCLYLSLGERRGLSAMVLFGMVGIVELMRGAFGGRGFDPTPFITAIAAWLLVLRGWRAFVPQVCEAAQE